MPKRFFPGEGRIIVKPCEADEKSPGGIIIPEQAKEKPTRGTVVTASSRLLDNGARVASDVIEGDTVYYQRYGGSEIEIEGEKYVVISHSDVLAVIR